MADLKDFSAKAFAFLQGGGEAGELTRQFDWSRTSLGTPEHWPQSLRTTIGLLLHSSFPTFLFWGKEDLVCFYNDAFRPSLGNSGKHPAIGKKAKDTWPEVWDTIKPLLDKVIATGESNWFENQLIPIYRNGKIEDVYWTFSHSPAYDDDGTINGIFVICTETTDQVHNSRMLRHSEQNFRDLIMNAPVGICMVRGESRMVDIVNESFLNLVGRSREEFENRPYWETLQQAEPYYGPVLDEVFSTGVTYVGREAEVTLVRNGVEELVSISFVYEPIKQSDNLVDRVMILGIEVSDQVRARKKAEKSESQVRAVVQSAPFPIGVYVGKEMRIELANQSIIDVWGKGQDVIGKTYYEVLPELHNQRIYEQLDRVFSTGEPFHARNQRVDLIIEGKLQPYYFNYSFTPLFDTDGTVYGVMNTAAEITDLVIAKQKIEQSENNFRTLIIQAPVAMCLMLGPNHVVEVANKLIIDLWGKPEHDVMNKPIFEALPEARDQGLEAILADVFGTGETFCANERPVTLLRNGKSETLYQNFVYEPYKDADGTILGIIAITIDVTEQVLARLKIEEIVTERTKELATANSNLQQSNAALAQFAYIASHDLQEPLRKVSTFTQMLESHLGTLDERGTNYLKKIKTSSQRMLTLIRDVLAYSELSRVEQSYELVDLKQVIKDIRTDFELLITEKKAQIRTKDLPTIEAIPLHMSQLFANLISNALKFVKPGSHPEITIEASVINDYEKKNIPALNQSGTYFKIEVKDNGIGFNQEHAEQIFNIFQRLHGKKQFEGTGIGLAMCQKIVHNHHGVIYARSEPDKGSSFVILLPEKQ